MNTGCLVNCFLRGVLVAEDFFRYVRSKVSRK